MWEPSEHREIIFQSLSLSSICKASVKGSTDRPTTFSSEVDSVTRNRSEDGRVRLWHFDMLECDCLYFCVCLQSKQNVIVNR